MTAAARVAVLVLAAGRGERLGHALPKAFVPIAGRSILERSIRALAESGVFAVIQPVLASAGFERFEGLGLQTQIENLARPIAGGRERQDSMRAGLAALPEEIEFVGVHDAARCLVSPFDVVAVVEAARKTGAAILAERSRDTIKRVVDGQVVETPDRQECWAAQTPQVARRDWLTTAVESALADGRQATDDAQLLEWSGRAVTVVESTAPNPKMTRPEDLLLAEGLLVDQQPAYGRRE